MIRGFFLGGVLAAPRGGGESAISVVGGKSVALSSPLVV